MSEYEKRPGGEAGAAVRSDRASTAKSRREAVLAEARAQGLEVEERSDGSIVIREPRKAKR